MKQVYPSRYLSEDLRKLRKYLKNYKMHVPNETFLKQILIVVLRNYLKNQTQQTSQKPCLLVYNIFCEILNIDLFLNSNLIKKYQKQYKVFI